MPLTRIQPAGLDSTKDYTFNRLTANTVIANGVDVSSGGGGGAGPKITNVQVTNSSYTLLDDTAVALTGGYVKITGTGFVTGCQVLINNTPTTSVTFVSATEVRAQVPATSAGTYIVYLVNPDGGVAIRVNGITFSGNPTWVTDTTLPSGVINEGLSIQLSTSGDTPITYALQAGSSLPTGLTLTSGGLLSGTVTGINSDTTYNFTIEATDAQSQESPRSFSITITAGDIYFRSTTLLLPGNATTFVSDASTNAFNITVNGDTRPNNFGPYTPGYYSNYFDGTGDYLIVPSTSSLSMGTGDFCIEMWIYPTALSATSQVLYANFSAGDTQMGIFIRDTSTIRFSSWDVAYLDSASGSIVNNIWQHIVVCRSSSTTSLFINGARAATNTVTTNFSSSAAFTIGCNPSNGTQLFIGYISNLRVIKGSALYNPSSTTITVPTTPLTAIANTSLLTCQSNRFIDNSTNNFTITVNGNTTINGFDPFVPNSSYATYGSGYFDGTGDWLLTSSSPATLSADFTIEGWVYITSFAAGRSIVCIGDDNTSTGALFFVNTSGRLAIFGNGGNILVGTSQTVLINTWNHIAFVRSSGTIRVYLNGVADSTTATNSTAFTGINRIGGELFAGNAGSTIMLGYISNYRLVNGTAVYTSAFTPPTSPLTAIANTSLLTLQTNQPTNNSMFLDNGTLAFPITRAGNSTQGSFTPYSPSSWSGYFDGTGDYLTFPSSTLIGSSQTTFTIEGWLYMTANPVADSSIQGAMFADGQATGVTNYLSMGPVGAGPYYFGFYWYDGATKSVRGNTTLSLNTWYHLAVSVSSNTIRLFVNGTLQTLTGTTTLTNRTGNNGTYTIGSLNNNGSSITGYISNLRVITGTAVYTDTFITPTAPLNAIANTSLLTLQDNRFIDDSINNFTITRNGDARVTNFNPFGSLTQTAYYSNFFDGDGDYLTVASSSAFNISGNFTIEGWYSFTALPGAGTNDNLWTFSGVATYNPYMYLWGDGTIILRTEQTGGTVFTITHNFVLNTWYHIALVKSGTTFTLYINGTSAGTGTSSAIVSQNKSLEIGGQSTFGFTGYLSNFRVVNGTAVYTANFTPSTTPLTAISGTQLLTCQSATFIDNSTNNFTLTVTGTPYPKIISPFTPPVTTGVIYSALTNGASGYFDGTGDYLSVPDNEAFNYTGDFTIECWLYPTSHPATVYLIGQTSSTDYAPVLIFLSSGRPGIAVSSNGSTWTINGFIATALTLNTWSHVAAVRNGNKWSIYVNGVENVIAASTAVTPYNSTDPLGIGSEAVATINYPYVGYISDLRIVKGTAVYTSSFVPPVQALTAVQNTVLLANFTGSGITDATAKNTLETVGDARISTVVSKFGGSSMFFDGTGDYMFPSGSGLNFTFGTGNFTIEMWCYFNSISSGLIYDGRPFQTNGVYPAIYITGGSLRYYVSTADRITSGTTLSTGVWYHIALTRSGTSTRMFINGTQTGSTYTDSNNYLVAAGRPVFGVSTFDFSGSPLNAYLSDVRITNGIARYTANFTAPTGALSKF